MQIVKMGLFATPTSTENIMRWIENLPPSDRVTAMTVMGMTWNYLAEQVNNDED